MAVICPNITSTIGEIPLVKLNCLAPEGVNLYVKIEAFNPGQTVVEATNGNTGIGLAVVCAEKGYPLVVTMAESSSIECRKLMRFLGAKVILTPAPKKGSGMLAKAVELAEKNGWFLTRQFENEVNARIHSETMAPETLSAMDGQKLDYWVTGYGTGGTLKGVARVLKEAEAGISESTPGFQLG